MINYVKENHNIIPDMQTKALKATNQLEYLCNLSVESQVGRRRLTGLACLISILEQI